MKLRTAVLPCPQSLIKTLAIQWWELAHDFRLHLQLTSLFSFILTEADGTHCMRNFTLILEMQDWNATSLFYHSSTPILPVYYPWFKLFFVYCITVSYTSNSTTDDTFFFPRKKKKTQQNLTEIIDVIKKEKKNPNKLKKPTAQQNRNSKRHMEASQKRQC